MDVLIARCCGLDIHKRLIVACLSVTTPTGQRHKEVRTFGTVTAEIEALAAWLQAAECHEVAMESTGVYWKPIYNLLEDRFVLRLVNPQHIKAVPGRKTDVRDCEWIADLLQHGLLPTSIVPSREQRELRELTRYRTRLVQERAAAVNRLQKTLEGANIKLASVATDILGRSGRAILAALVAGSADAAELAQLARGRLRAKLPQLEQALVGSFGPHQRWLVAEQLAHIDDLETSIATLSERIAQQLQPHEALIRRLMTIPGVGWRTAEVLLAELGTDMSRWPTAAHLASWAGMCPGNNQSAGKRGSGRTRSGNTWLRAALIEAAQAAAHTKATYLAAQYQRLAARRGAKKAAVAVGHTILRIAYEIVGQQTTYVDLGPHYFDERRRQAVERRLVRRLEALGHRVTLEPATAPTA